MTNVATGCGRIVGRSGRALCVWCARRTVGAVYGGYADGASAVCAHQYREDFPCFGTPLFPAAYTSAGNYFGVPAITATSVDKVHAAVAQGLQSTGPVIVEAMVDPFEYEELIRFNPRPASRQGDPHAS